MEMPTALVLNLIDVDHHCESDTTWTYTQEDSVGVLRSASGIELKICDGQVQEYLMVLQGVYQTTDKEEKNMEIRLIQAIVGENAAVVPKLLEALNFASQLSPEFWYFCGCVVDCKSITHSDVLTLLQPAQKMDLWRIVDKLPCQPVLTYISATEDHERGNLLHNIRSLSWHKEDKRLWLDLLFCHFLKQCLYSGLKDFFAEDGTRMGPISQLVFNSLPEEIRYSPEAIQLLFDHNCVYVIEKALGFPHLPLTDIARACVPYLCSDAGKNKLELFRRVVPSLEDEDLWWKLVSSFNHPQVQLVDVCSNWMLNTCEVPGHVFKTLCEVPDCNSRTLRLAVYGNKCFHNKWDCAAAGTLSPVHNEHQVEQNFVVVIQKLDNASKKLLIRFLIAQDLMLILKNVSMVLEPSFPLLKIAATYDAFSFLGMSNMFNYSADSSSNKKLAHLFYGRLCEVSWNGGCSVALANYLLRMFDKNPVQKLQGDAFVIQFGCCQTHSIEACCAMCRNLFQAASCRNFDAIRHFLTKPK